MKKAQLGFTLIELMIVIAIIGILAAVAIPQYQDYIIRTESSNSLAAVRPVQLDVGEYAARYADLPPTCVELTAYSGISCTATDHELGNVASIGIGALGVLTVTMKGTADDVPADIADTTYLVTPASNASGAVSWTIASGGGNAMDPKFVPRR